MFFIAIGIPQAIPGISTTGSYTTILPLLFFICLTIAKEGFDDYRRHRLDKVENANLAYVLRPKGQTTAAAAAIAVGFVQSLCKLVTENPLFPRFLQSNSKSRSDFLPLEEDTDDMYEWTAVKWRDIKVGDIVRLKRDDPAPADVVLLYASNENGVAYIETMALDGETNLKIRQALHDFEHCGSIKGIKSTTANFSVEDPNMDLYDFNGRVVISDDKTLPLTLDHVIFRGSVLRNTTLATGLVINTGEECKIRMNASHHPKAKKPRLERTSNHIVLTLILYVVLLSVGCSMGYLMWHRRQEVQAWYLVSASYNASISFRDIVIGFLIMFNNVIPLAMYISLEVVKVGQMLLVQSDVGMYDAESDRPMTCNTNTILENLGQVSHIFSDKTGTLTENVMNFRKMSIAGLSFSHHHQQPSQSDNGKAACDDQDKTPEERDFTSSQLTNHIRLYPDLPFSKRARDFILGMALCHTALPQTDAAGHNDFESPSPDEVALVRAAHELGYTLISRSSRTITLRLTDRNADSQEKEEEEDEKEEDQQYEILDIIPFTSKRKRMSIILRCPDGKIWLICKGADSVIVPRLEQSSLAMRKSLDVRRSRQFERDEIWESQQDRADFNRDYDNLPSSQQGLVNEHTSRPIPLEDIEFRFSVDAMTNDSIDADILNGVELMDESAIFSRCFGHMDDFATEGLRTLLYAHRIISDSEFLAWKQLYSEATTSLTNRKELIDAAGDMIETNLELLGASAIEDKLQRGVPETIDKLQRAQIKIWMLTGDKRETAINIAYAAGICKPLSELFVLDVSKPEYIADQMQDLMYSIPLDPNRHHVTAIDGNTLGVIEKDAVLCKTFYQLISQVDSVICCRASPAQKAGIIRGVRSSLPKALTLAIGDGGNDIAMIQDSHVGVGISGKEGLQAARVADYSIAQFRFLQRLLLVHGRWNYIRTAKFILWTFFKEFFFYMMQALYQRYDGYTGSSLYENWSLTVLNTLFTSLCVIVPGIFEQDLEATTLLAVPELYTYGIRNKALNLYTYIWWMALAAAEGLAVWFIVWAAWGHHMGDNGAFALGNLCFSLGIAWQNIKLLLLETHRKTVIIYASFFITFAGWWVWNAFLSGTYSSNLSPFDVKDGFAHGFGTDLAWWATFLLVLTALVVVEVSYKAGLRCLRQYLGYKLANNGCRRDGQGLVTKMSGKKFWELDSPITTIWDNVRCGILVETNLDIGMWQEAEADEAVMAKLQAVADRTS
jgi:phospholipid-translocating ATPase